MCLAQKRCALDLAGQPLPFPMERDSFRPDREQGRAGWLGAKPGFKRNTCQQDTPGAKHLACQDIRLTHEISDEGIGGFVINFPRRAHLRDLAGARRVRRHPAQ